MTSALQDCNRLCREKYSKLTEQELEAKILQLDPSENPYFLKSNVADYKEGLLKKLCIIECGAVAKT